MKIYRLKNIVSNGYYYGSAYYSSITHNIDVAKIWRTPGPLKSYITTLITRGTYGKNSENIANLMIEELDLVLTGTKTGEEFHSKPKKKDSKTKGEPIF